jgi:3-oxoacyl-[acyl-carrier-protein] synthase II
MGTPTQAHTRNHTRECVCARARTQVRVSSTKGATGHLLGAAGAVESVFTVLAVVRTPTVTQSHARTHARSAWQATGLLPPTRNLASAAVGVPLGIIGTGSQPEEMIARPRRAAVNNSFGFGGTNCSLLFVAL